MKWLINWNEASANTIMMTKKMIERFSKRLPRRVSIRSRIQSEAK